MGSEDTIDLDRKVEWSFGAYLGHCNSQREVVQVQWLGWLVKTKGNPEIPQGPSNTDKKNLALLFCKNLDKRSKKSVGGGVIDCLKVERLLHTLPSAEHSQMACSGSSRRL